MNASHRTIAAVTALAAALTTAPQAAAQIRNPRPIRAERIDPYVVALRADPTSSVLRLMPNMRAVVDSSFTMTSAVCTDCGIGCPDPSMTRTIEVQLQATEAVAAGYGVSSLTTSNWTVTMPCPRSAAE